jgi:hypothetical protein
MKPTVVFLALAGILHAGPDDLSSGGMFEAGRSHLVRIEKRIASDTGDVQARMDRLRTLYFLSVGDADLLPEAERSLAWLVARSRIESDLRQAYKGAFEVVRAKHGLWPPGKLDALKRARPLLDGAVARSPNHVEIRFLRLISCYHLPFFFGRSWSVEEDFGRLAKLLPEASDPHLAGLRTEISAFVLAKYRNLAPTDRSRLTDLVRSTRLAANSTKEGT